MNSKRNTSVPTIIGSDGKEVPSVLSSLASTFVLFSFAVSIFKATVNYRRKETNRIRLKERKKTRFTSLPSLDHHFSKFKRCFLRCHCQNRFFFSCGQNGQEPQKWSLNQSFISVLGKISPWLFCFLFLIDIFRIGKSRIFWTISCRFIDSILAIENLR